VSAAVTIKLRRVAEGEGAGGVQLKQLRVRLEALAVI